MEKRSHRPSSGARAVAIDGNKIMARYRLLFLLTLIFCASFAAALQFIFGR